MNTTTFIASLPPEISRSNVLSLLKGQLGDITDNLESSLSLALEAFPKNYTFRSAIGRKLEAALSRTSMGALRDHWIYDARNTVENIKKILPTMISNIESLGSNTIYSAGIDLRTANILQLAEANRFLLNYIPLMLLWVTSAEAATEKSTAKEALSVGLRNWLSDNMLAFVSLVSLYRMPAETVIKQLNSIVRVPVTNIDFTSALATQSNKVESIRLSLLGVDVFSSVVSGVSYRLGKIWAEYSVARYNEQRELKSALELRLIELKMARGNETDAVLTKRIAYTEDRLAKLNATIRHFEEV